jgi:hypothetical protein
MAATGAGALCLADTTTCQVITDQYFHSGRLIQYAALVIPQYLHHVKFSQSSEVIPTPPLAVVFRVYCAKS